MIDTIPYPGSKRTCVDRLLPLLGVGPLLVSPFVGMAALEVAALEARRFDRALLSDSSPHVIAVLSAIQTDPARVGVEQERQRARIAGDADELAAVQVEIGEALRVGAPTWETAGRILGASCWSYSRLWRVNGAGQMNTPVDRRGRPAVASATLQRYAAALARADIRLCPWTDALAGERRATLYVDPPYLGAGGFVEYTAAGWREADALALADRLAELRGCRVILSEQEPGGGALYHARISAARRCTRHAFERRRNLRGDQMSAVRREITLVSPAIV